MKKMKKRNLWVTMLLLFLFAASPLLTMATEAVEGTEGIPPILSDSDITEGTTEGAPSEGDEALRPNSDSDAVLPPTEDETPPVENEIPPVSEEDEPEPFLLPLATNNGAYVTGSTTPYATVSEAISHMNKAGTVTISGDVPWGKANHSEKNVSISIAPENSSLGAKIILDEHMYLSGDLRIEKGITLSITPPIKQAPSIYKNIYANGHTFIFGGNTETDGATTKLDVYGGAQSSSVASANIILNSGQFHGVYGAGGSEDAYVTGTVTIHIGSGVTITNSVYGNHRGQGAFSNQPRNTSKAVAVNINVEGTVKLDIFGGIGLNKRTTPSTIAVIDGDVIVTLGNTGKVSGGTISAGNFSDGVITGDTYTIANGNCYQAYGAGSGNSVVLGDTYVSFSETNTYPQNKIIGGGIENATVYGNTNVFSNSATSSSIVGGGSGQRNSLVKGNTNITLGSNAITKTIVGGAHEPGGDRHDAATGTTYDGAKVLGAVNIIIEKGARVTNLIYGGSQGNDPSKTTNYKETRAFGGETSVNIIVKGYVASILCSGMNTQHPIAGDANITILGEGQVDCLNSRPSNWRTDKTTSYIAKKSIATYDGNTSQPKYITRGFDMIRVINNSNVRMQEYVGGEDYTEINDIMGLYIEGGSTLALSYSAVIDGNLTGGSNTTAGKLVLPAGKSLIAKGSISGALDLEILERAGTLGITSKPAYVAELHQAYLVSTAPSNASIRWVDTHTPQRFVLQNSTTVFGQTPNVNLTIEAFLEKTGSRAAAAKWWLVTPPEPTSPESPKEPVLPPPVEVVPPVEEPLLPEIPPTEETLPEGIAPDNTTPSQPTQDPNTAPPPRNVGSTLVPNEAGEFIEIDENGVPLGKWVWEEAEEAWVFIPQSEIPLGDIPNTNDPMAKGFLEDVFLFSGSIMLLLFCKKRYASK